MPSQRSEPSGPSAAPLDASTELLDSRAVAVVLGVGRTKVFEMMARHDLPTIHIGRCVRVPRRALADWIRANTDDPSPRASRESDDVIGWHLARRQEA